MSLRATVVSFLTIIVIATATTWSGTAAAEDAAVNSTQGSPGLQVAFPELTEFNPKYRTYTVTVDDDPSLESSGDLFADFKGLRTPLPHYGSAEVALPSGHLTGQVAILRCTNGVCDGTGDLSPELYLADSLIVSAQADSGPWSLAFPVEVTFGTAPRATPEQIDATWRLIESTDPTSAVVAQGSAAVSGPNQLTVDLPASVPTGRYGLVVDVGTDMPDYGPLSGSSAPMDVSVDNTGPQVDFDVSSTKLFPVKDDYLDQVAITMPELKQGTQRIEIDIVAADGTASRIYEGAPLGNRTTLNFRGVVREPVAGPLPAGRYTLRLRGYDDLNNRSELTKPLTIDYRKVVIHTWRKTLTPAASFQDSTTGACASLARTVPGRTAGTLGYYSQSKCAKFEQTIVGTLHRVAIPASDTGRYGRGRLSIVGGAAKGGAGSTITTAFLQGGENTTGDTTHGSAWGPHRGRWGGTPMIYQPRPRSRAVYWQAATGGGSRYDISSFTIELELWDLK